MKEYVKQRVLEEATLIISTGATLKELSKKYNITTRTVSEDIGRLKEIDYDLYLKTVAKLDDVRRKNGVIVNKLNKYKRDFILRLADEYCGGTSIGGLCVRYKITRNTIIKYFNLYLVAIDEKLFSRVCSLMEVNNSSSTLRYVNYIIKNKASYSEVAAHFDVDKNTIYTSLERIKEIEPEMYFKAKDTLYSRSNSFVVQSVRNCILELEHSSPEKEE